MEISDDEEAKAARDRHTFRQNPIYEAGIGTNLSGHLHFTGRNVILRRRLEYTSCETVRIISRQGFECECEAEITG